METLLIDGYNVLGYLGQMGHSSQSGHTQLADDRDALIHRLDDYAGYIGCVCIVVFDGHHARHNRGDQQQVGGITVVYTKTDVSADVYIEKLAAFLVKQGKDVRVVSGDAVEQALIFSFGAYRMPVRELLYEMDRAIERHQKHRKSGNPQRLHAHVDAKTYAALEEIRLGENANDAG
ncbi:NYN domain-containing protein [Eubacteriales bacterium OttesenSCG-928-N14]|nr:NYN domain-containing protein [Eubacteriales bacterium OttesenSCG-928-N14]